jgi:DNA-binding transcriptional LysR family regulator
MPYFLKDFLAMNQSVELIMDVTNKSTVIEHLEKNIVDFALVSVLPENMNIEAIPLLENKLYLIDDCNKNYKKKEQNHSLLEKIPMIFREQGSGTRLVMERFFKKKNLSVTKKLELTSNEAVKQAVIAGLGASIMPIIGVKNELLRKELQVVPIKDFPIESTWYLIYLKNKNLTNIAQNYVDFIQKEKNRIIKDYFDWYKDY